MESFDFETNLKNLDDRSVFANKICKLIYEKHDGDLIKSVEEATSYFVYLEQFVRNIYECIDSEVPLYAYYQLLEYGADNWDFDSTEYEEAKRKTEAACVFYYGGK